MQIPEGKNVIPDANEQTLAKGFVFDIDGTLVSRDNHEVDDYLISRMVGTLKLLRPVIFATGRSVESVNEMVLNKLLGKLTEIEKEILLKNLFIISNNGANIFSVSYISGKLVFGIEQKKHLKDGDKILEIIQQKFPHRIAPKEKDFVSRSKNGVVTVVLKESGSITVAEIESLLNLSGFQDFQIMKSGEKTIDITAKDVDKEHGIRFISSKKNLRDSLLARFGDQVQEGGNDARMLSNGIPIKVTDPSDTKGKIKEVKIIHNATLGAQDVEKRGTVVLGLFEKIKQNRLKANSLLEFLTNSENFEEFNSTLMIKQFAVLVANEIMERFSNKSAITIAGIHSGSIEIPSVIKHYLKELGYQGEVNIIQADTGSGDIKFLGEFEVDQEVFLVDDYVFTGKTIAGVAENLVRKGANVHLRVMQIATAGKVKDVDTGGIEKDFVDSHLKISVVGYKTI